jgi:endonuclease-3 related protein
MEGPQAGLRPVRGLFCPPDGALHALYTDLVAIYGEQPWWPAETPFEVVVGAVLTQNAAWSNVEKAIDRLRAARLLSLNALLATGHADLADAIRPSGYFNVKARRLRNLCEFLAAQGGLEGFSEHPLPDQRAGLLSVNGIGPETADDILLYALEQPVFVIDSYTRRLLRRLGWSHGRESYEDLRAGFERALSGGVYQYQQFHALIVMHAKEVCRKVPRCAQCPLAPECPAATR